VNLGNPNENSINELAGFIIGLTKSRSQIAFHPLPSDDPRRRRPDITLARERLGWEPKVNIEDGLKKTIQYFREIIS
jgi:UDP-glucuronate decarboxylase